MKTIVASLLLALVGGLLWGLAVGRRSNSEEDLGISAEATNENSGVVTKKRVEVDPIDSDDSEKIVIELIGATEAFAALKTIAAGVSPLADQIPIYDLIARVNANELMELLIRFLDTPNSRFQTEVGNILLFRIAHERPMELANRFAGIGLSDFEKGSLQTIVRALAWRSLASAVDFLDRLPEDFPNLGAVYAGLASKAKAEGNEAMAGNLNSILRQRFPEATNESLSIDEMRSQIVSRNWESDRSGFLKRFSRFSQEHPGEALAMALTLDDGDVVKREGVQGALAALSVKDPFKALEYSYLSPEYGHRGFPGIFAEAFARVALKDEKRAFQWLQELSGPMKSQVLRSVSGKPNLSEQIVPVIAEMKTGPDRERLLVRALGGWAKQDREKASVWAAEHLSERELAAFKVNQLRYTAKEDPSEALAFLANLDQVELRRRGAQQFMGAWSDNEIPDLLDYISEVEDEGIREMALMGISDRWAQSDVDGAAVFSQSLPEGTLRAQFERSVGNVLVRAGSPSEAIDYALGMNDSNTANSVMHSALNSIASFDPEQALSIATSNTVLTDVQRKSLIGSVSQIWAQSDPGAAARYLTGLNDPAALGGMQDVAMNWGRIDASKALNWSMTIPNTVTRDQIITALLSDRNIMEAAPFEVENALASISDPQQRENALRRIERNLEVKR